MDILHWTIEPELRKEAQNNYRTNFALGLRERSALDIIRELTFDGVVDSITPDDVSELFNFVEQKFLHNKIAGKGIEVGAGPGTFSAILAKRSAVNKMYALEICEPIVELLTPKVVTGLAVSQANKVVGVVGDFNHIELPDNSLDFAIDFFSLHHSNDINVTIKELYRVIKPGGFVLCFDKARPDNFSDKDLNELLDSVYPESYNHYFGLPLEQRMTRRLNGEREYRLMDWRLSFVAGGFGLFEHYCLAKTAFGNKVNRNIKQFISIMPIGIQLIVNKFLPLPRANHKFILSSDNRVFARPVNAFRKEISLMIAYKVEPYQI